MVTLLITSFLSSNVISIYKSKDLFPYHHFQICMLLYCVQRPYFYLAKISYCQMPLIVSSVMMSIPVTYISVPLPSHFFTVNSYTWNDLVKHKHILRLWTNFCCTVLFVLLTEGPFIWILILRCLVQLCLLILAPCLGKKCIILWKGGGTRLSFTQVTCLF